MSAHFFEASQVPVPLSLLSSIEFQSVRSNIKRPRLGFFKSFSNKR
ncbi:hypothetical protein M901_3277, partial [Bacteriovorax sp. DB6_IX]